MKRHRPRSEALESPTRRQYDPSVSKPVYTGCSHSKLKWTAIFGPLHAFPQDSGPLSVNCPAVRIYSVGI